MKKAAFVVLVSVLVITAGQAAFATAAVAFTSPAFDFSNFTDLVGWQFAVNNNITVDALGFYDNPANGIHLPTRSESTMLPHSRWFFQVWLGLQIRIAPGLIGRASRLRFSWRDIRTTSLPFSMVKTALGIPTVSPSIRTLHTFGASTPTEPARYRSPLAQMVFSGISAQTSISKVPGPSRNPRC